MRSRTVRNAKRSFPELRGRVVLCVLLLLAQLNTPSPADEAPTEPGGQDSVTQSAPAEKAEDAEQAEEAKAVEQTEDGEQVEKDEDTEQAKQAEEAKEVEQVEQVEQAAKSPSVIAHFHLSGMLTETPFEDPFGFSAGQATSLQDLLLRLNKARKDDSIDGVVLTFDMMFFGLGQLEELRKALMAFRKADKPVFVHTGSMTTPVYALLSAASDLSMVPQSDLWLVGLYGESLYVKGLLDKIGVQADMMSMGAYKSAAEMLTRKGPSEEAEENLNWLLDDLYSTLVHMIADGRGLDPKQVRDLIDDAPFRAQRALEVGLVDAIEYRDDFMARIRETFGKDARINNRYAVKKGPKINFANPFAFFSVFGEMARKRQKGGKNKVALIYVEGAIMLGHGQSGPFGQAEGAYSEDLRKALETATKDETIKAVVLRVDSPGGSAEASEIIHRATLGLKGSKPMVVSMGNVAGSGGYYVACGADQIFADETTITASIGVVGGKFVTIGMWDKLGVTVSAHKRGANADLFNTLAPYNVRQRERMARFMEEVYESFKARVREGRGNKLAKPVEEMAGGRVYTGRQALQLGLIDRIGGVNDAIAYAAKRAKLKKFDVVVVPPPRDFFSAMMQEMADGGERPSDISLGTGSGPIDLAAPPLQMILSALARLDPQRARALTLALERVRLIGREGVALMMPYDFVIY